MTKILEKINNLDEKIVNKIEKFAKKHKNTRLENLIWDTIWVPYHIAKMILPSPNDTYALKDFKNDKFSSSFYLISKYAFLYPITYIAIKGLTK